MRPCAELGGLRAVPPPRMHDLHGCVIGTEVAEMISHQGAARAGMTAPRSPGPGRAPTPIHAAPAEDADPGSRRILIVDDEPNIRSFIGRALAAVGYATDFAGNGTEGLRHALDDRYDLIILDLVMPDLDGCSVLDQLLRARPDQTVMVLSCVADVATKVDCLERGARDYLTKPFSLAELLVRIRVRLTRLEFLLLRELAEHFGQSVPKGRLLASVWGYHFDPGSNVVDVCVRRLRSKLGFNLIKTVRGEGYQLADR